ncbi:short chain dehydrogenase family protein [Collimonas fungivorans]|uniref:Short chain dehydrogenase family protein n=1 Tax=Collimonas fungivorans TaxID=158899 RepID=A0A127PG18_9BURK|nr:short chain dehydrogenase family protein [Collimonas fungivorans]
MADHSITGKVILIAGGAKNLGGLIARDLARHGAKAVAVHYNSAAARPTPMQPLPQSRLPERRLWRSRPT